MIKNYEHLFGPRTGLEKYYGKPLRAVFNDSYEFAVDRHFSDDFIAYFNEKRGYDVTLWLPANMQRKYNYAQFKKTGTEQPDYSFGPEDRRIRYDYDLTLSELFGTHFIGASSRWLEQRGMLHRTQAYGMTMDMIAAAGRASIPETESMLGSELLIKLMSSGAHLYNRPLLSAETAVFINRGYTTMPQAIRLAVDKLFAAGANQIIYHGVPYRYFNEATTSAGWYPFYMVYANFSVHLGEGWSFWKYQKEINEYVARTQYALRSGKPCTDVFVCYPFDGIESLHVKSDLTGVDDLSNSEEIFTKGYLPEEHASRLSREEPEGKPDIYSVLNQLEASGLT